MSIDPADFARDGFAVIPDLLPAGEIAGLKRECQALVTAHAAGRSVLVGASLRGAGCAAVATGQRTQAALAPLMPEGIAFLSDKIVLKDAACRAATPWHQDVAYWPGTRPKLSLWIALDAVDEGNGALRVLPGSHRAAVGHRELAAGHIPDGSFRHALPLGDDPPGALTVALPAGWAVAFSDLLIHGSHPNRTGGDRLSLIGTYHAPGADEGFDLGFPGRRVLAAPAEARP